LKFPIRTLLFAAALLAPTIPAQTPPSYKSVEVNPDHTVTFRFFAPGASNVKLHVATSVDPLPMTKDSSGIWTATSSPLAPEIYGYNFDVDGRPVFDSKNPWNVIQNYVSPGNQFEIPGDTPQLWDIQDVPHGELHTHYYTSKIIQGLDANQEEYIVYTPPNYDPHAKLKYPVLYLLHGWSGYAFTWSSRMQANIILDNLLAQHKILPMLVVMPKGYGEMNFVQGVSITVWQDHQRVNRNTNLFSDALLTEIIPRVESEYNASTKREDRAIAGLSMGGLESLTIGLNHTSQFAYIGGFSSAVTTIEDPSKHFPDLATTSGAKAADLHLLWIACGLDDHLIGPNRKLITWLKAQGLPVTPIETQGAHVGHVWRENLIQFAPLLFR
jgi:enterochelin esterase family protein